MEITGFTTWLLMDGLRYPESDPVFKYARKVNRDVEWPCLPSYQTFEEVIAHHEKWDKGAADVLYSAKLAWGDFEKWKKTN